MPKKKNKAYEKYLNQQDQMYHEYCSESTRVGKLPTVDLLIALERHLNFALGCSEAFENRHLSFDADNIRGIVMIAMQRIGATTEEMLKKGVL